MEVLRNIMPESVKSEIPRSQTDHKGTVKSKNRLFLELDPKTPRDSFFVVSLRSCRHCSSCRSSSSTWSTSSGYYWRKRSGEGGKWEWNRIWDDALDCAGIEEWTHQILGKVSISDTESESSMGLGFYFFYNYMRSTQNLCVFCVFIYAV